MIPTDEVIFFGGVGILPIRLKSLNKKSGQKTWKHSQVVMVVHQPRYSLFTLFDNVLLLGMGGRTVYLSESTGALPYFRELGFKMPEHERLSKISAGNGM